MPKKGKDYWVDISDNNQARLNLFKFLNNNYNMSGYEDREKEIYDLIQKGKFDYYTFGNNQNIPQKTPVVFKNKTQTKNISSKKKIQTKDNNSYLDFLKVENPGDIGHIWNSILNGEFKQAFGIINNGIQRKIEKRRVNDPISDFKIPGQSDTSTKYAIRPNSFTGDTIRTFNQKITPQQYIIPESVDVNEYTFGYRNRGNYNPINTEAAAITSFRNFKPLVNTMLDIKLTQEQIRMVI